MMWCLLAATLYSSGPVVISGERQVDPARSLFISVEPKGIELRDRFRGFRVAEDYDDERATHWRLEPEPAADAYKIAPFAFGGKVHGPVYFDPPPPRSPVSGDMEVNPRKVMLPITWRRAAIGLAILLATAAAIFGLWKLARLLARRVREHYMSPIERAWAELERLIRSKLPERGRFKDFYVELTMVVRRYIQRKYAINAPHLTTEEFLREAIGRDIWAAKELGEFLGSADMVKFAGVAATLEMASDATNSAREFLARDEKL